jgi:hypothetical protein
VSMNGQGRKLLNEGGSERATGANEYLYQE